MEKFPVRVEKIPGYLDKIMLFLEKIISWIHWHACDTVDFSVAALFQSLLYVDSLLRESRNWLGRHCELLHITLITFVILQGINTTWAQVLSYCHDHTHGDGGILRIVGQVLSYY